MSDKIYLIDGTNHIFRAYYAIRNLSTSAGFPTNAIYGFTNMLLRLIRDEKPTHLAVVFDSGKPSFREDIYPEYKAHRPSPPDDLIRQFPEIPRVVEAMNIPVLSIEGVEADDVIGTLAMRAVKNGHDAVIVTGDKDFMQLVGEHVSLLDTMKGKLIKTADVVEKFGVPPEKVTDVLGLCGDASDNIPGIHGVGPKTATKLINEFGSIEALIKDADKLEGGLKDKIKSESHNAILSKRLATIHTDVKIAADYDDLSLKPYDEAKLRDIFREFEFSQLLAEMTPSSVLSRDKYELVMTEPQLVSLVKKLSAANVIAFDTETTSLDAIDAKLVGLSFSWKRGHAAYIPVGHTGLDAANQPELSQVIGLLAPVLNDPNIKKVGQNLKYDLAVLDKYKVDVSPVECDTMIASYVINPAAPHGMDDMAEQFLGHTTIKYEDVTGKGKKQINFSEVEILKACEYSAEDADVTFRLYEKLMPKLQEQGLEKLFFEMEMPLMHVLLKMELAGVKIDCEKLGKMSGEFETELKKLEERIFAAAGEQFNINSPKQLGLILFEKMGISGGKKTKTGYSTDVDVLNSLAAKHEIAKLILEYRSISKLKGTYIDALPLLVKKETGRVHTSFNQTVAETGRLSSSEPNLQNIPIRSPLGKKIREAFIAEDGFVLLSADYSQIELRILAHIAGEQVLIDAFNKGVDVHAVTAAGIFGISPDQVGKEERAVGKTVNFATIYGQSAFGLSKQLGIDPATAKEYIENYFAKYPEVQRYREKALDAARENGFVETLFGRRRYVPEINSKNGAIRQFAERMAFNTIFQGTAADIIKRAMIDVDSQLEKISPRARLLLQVHDELVLEVPSEDVKKVQEFIVEKMSNAAKLRVPLEVDCAVGNNWAEC